MKKMKGSALLWCLAVLIVLSIITLTGVSLSVSYYKSAIHKAGNDQADYNAMSAAETVKSQLTGTFDGKQIYFTYSGDSFDTVGRSTTVTQMDKDYFGSIIDSGNGRNYFIAARKLENELMNDYLSSKNTLGYQRKPVRMTFNFGKIDTTVNNHGYYGNSADLYIQSIEPVDEDGDTVVDYYVAVLKAIASTNAGHTEAVGVRFKTSPVRVSAQNIPIVSACMMRLGISPETESTPVTDPTTGETVYPLIFPNAQGVVLGFADTGGTDTQSVLLFGDKNSPNILEAADINALKSLKDIRKYGYVKTDGYIGADGILYNETSYLDDSFKIVYPSGDTAMNTYADLHSSYAFTEDYPEYRDTDTMHSSGNLELENSSDKPSTLEVFYELPNNLFMGSNADNRVKRYYVVSGNRAPMPTDDGEYAMGFRQYVNSFKSGSPVSGDDGFTDKYNRKDDLICCIVEDVSKKFTVNSVTGDYTYERRVDPNETLILEDIFLESGKTYFFRICQNTRISFDPNSTGGNVYFQLYNDIENYKPEGDTMDKLKNAGYRIDLDLVNPPSNVNFFAFDSNIAGSGKGTIKPASIPTKPMGKYIDTTKNVNIIVNNDTPMGNYVINGWFSCYMFSVLDESIRSETDLEILSPKKVELKLATPERFVTVTRKKSTADANNFMKNYSWVFDRYVDVDTEIPE